MGLGDLYTEAPDHKRAAWASHSMLPIVDTPNLAYCWTTAKRGVEEGVKLGLLNIGKIAERVDFMLLTFDGPLMRLKVHRRSKNVQSGGSNFVTSFVAEVEVDSSDKRGVMYEILKIFQEILSSPDSPFPNVFVLRDDEQSDSKWAIIYNALVDLGFPSNAEAAKLSPNLSEPPTRVGASDMPWLREIISSIGAGALPDDHFARALLPSLPIPTPVTNDNDGQVLLPYTATVARSLFAPSAQAKDGDIVSWRSYDVGQARKGLVNGVREKRAPEASDEEILMREFIVRGALGDCGLLNLGGRRMGWVTVWMLAMGAESFEEAFDNIAEEAVVRAAWIEHKQSFLALQDDEGPMHPPSARQSNQSSNSTTITSHLPPSISLNLFRDSFSPPSAEVAKFRRGLIMGAVKEVGDVVPSHPFWNAPPRLRHIIKERLARDGCPTDGVDAAFDTPSKWVLAPNPSPATTLVQHRLLGLLDIQPRNNSPTSPVPNDLWQKALVASGIFTPNLPSYYGSFQLGDSVAAPLFLASLPPLDLHRLIGASSTLVGSIKAEMRLVGWRQDWQAALRPTTFDDDEEAAEEADEDDFEDLSEDMFLQLFGQESSSPQSRRYIASRPPRISSSQKIVDALALLDPYASLLASTGAFTGQADAIKALFSSKLVVEADQVARLQLSPTSTLPTVLAEAFDLALPVLRKSEAVVRSDVIAALRPSASSFKHRSEGFRTFMSCLGVDFAFEPDLEHFRATSNAIARAKRSEFLLVNGGAFDTAIFQNPLIALKALAPPDLLPSSSTSPFTSLLLGCAILLARLYPTATTITTNHLLIALKYNYLRQKFSYVKGGLIELGVYEEVEPLLELANVRRSFKSKDKDCLATIVTRLTSGELQIGWTHPYVMAIYNPSASAPDATSDKPVQSADNEKEAGSTDESRRRRACRPSTSAPTLDSESDSGSDLAPSPLGTLSSYTTSFKSLSSSSSTCSSDPMSSSAVLEKEQDGPRGAFARRAVAAAKPQGSKITVHSFAAQVTQAEIERLYVASVEYSFDPSRTDYVLADAWLPANAEFLQYAGSAKKVVMPQWLSRLGLKDKGQYDIKPPT